MALQPLGPPGQYQTFDLSLDGAELVTTRGDLGGLQNLWVTDTNRVGFTPLTQGIFTDADPRWSLDRREVTFGSSRAPRRAPHRVARSGGSPQLVMPSEEDSNFALDDWARDGHLLYHPAAGPVMWARKPGAQPIEVVRLVAGGVDQGSFSPNGRFVALQASDSAGAVNVAVVPFPPTGERWNISTTGGLQPVWSADGRELFYLTPDRVLMSVSVDTTRAFMFGEPRRLFQTPLVGRTGTEEYAVHPDGRFLMLVPEDDTGPPFTVITDWLSLMKR